jgi:hypothetical protein
MGKASGLRPARWSILRSHEERLLLDLAIQSGPVGDTALSVIVHLPLRPQTREQLHVYLCQRLSAADSEEESAFLRELEGWISGDSSENASVGRGVYRENLDSQWIQSTAPGFSLGTDEDYSDTGLESEQGLLELAAKLKENSWRLDAPPTPLEPKTVNRLFQVAMRDGPYDVWLGNAIVSNVSKMGGEFKPVVAGLFYEYQNAALSWCAFVGQDIGLWYLDGRDDDERPCWRSWQLAWVSSRGGLSGLVEALRTWLESKNSSEQIIALAMLSDVADYVVQEKPAIFGGGQRPPRVSPVDLAKTPAEAPARLGISAPAEVEAGRSFVARLVAYVSGEEERAEKLLRGSRGRSEPAIDQMRCRWPLGTLVDVDLSGDHLEILEPHRQFVWEGEVAEAVFDVKVLQRVPEIVLRFDVSANRVPAANLRLEVDVKPSVVSPSTPGAAADMLTSFQYHQGKAAASAFASYASADRSRVLDGVNTMKSVGIDVFADCLDLHPGEKWKERLSNELKERDLFVLFWSQAASISRWVSWELNTVLDERGEEVVCVNPLEPNIRPPDRLSHLHFSSTGVWVRAAVATASYAKS